MALVYSRHLLGHINYAHVRNQGQTAQQIGTTSTIHFEWRIARGLHPNKLIGIVFVVSGIQSGFKAISIQWIFPISHPWTRNLQCSHGEGCRPICIYLVRSIPPRGVYVLHPRIEYRIQYAILSIQHLQGYWLLSIRRIWRERPSRCLAKQCGYLLSSSRGDFWQLSLPYEWRQIYALFRQFIIVIFGSTLYAWLIIKIGVCTVKLITAITVHLQLWCISSIGIWTIYNLTLGIVKPQEHKIFRVSYYGMTWNGWFMKHVQKPLQPILSIIAHWILKSIVREIAI